MFCTQHAEEGMVYISGRSRGAATGVVELVMREQGIVTLLFVLILMERGRAALLHPPRRSLPPEGAGIPTKIEKFRRSAGEGGFYVVRVKREGADNRAPPDDEKPRACSEPERVVKTEEVGVFCKAEPTEAADARKARMKRGESPRGRKHKVPETEPPAAATPECTPQCARFARVPPS